MVPDLNNYKEKPVPHAQKRVFYRCVPHTCKTEIKWMIRKSRIYEPNKLLVDYVTPNIHFTYRYENTAFIFLKTAG